jgi:predicted RNA-binding Zn-ribbon protein involved in translation (DUF1610 family)
MDFESIRSRRQLVEALKQETTAEEDSYGIGFECNHCGVQIWHERHGRWKSAATVYHVHNCPFTEVQVRLKLRPAINLPPVIQVDNLIFVQNKHDPTEYEHPLGIELWCNRFNNGWSATMSGPWHSDSNPEGEGITAREAVLDLRNTVRDYRDALKAF